MTLKAKIRLQKSTPKPVAKSIKKPVCRPVTSKMPSAADLAALGNLKRVLLAPLADMGVAVYSTPALPKVPAKVAHQMARRRIAAAKLQVADHEYSKRIPEIKRLIKESVAKLPKDAQLNGAKILAKQLTTSLDEWQRLYKSTPK
jgi:hypothetical protein